MPRLGRRRVIGPRVGAAHRSAVAAAAAAPAVRAVVSILGDSFAAENEQNISRTGSVIATDGASNQLATLMGGVTWYTTDTTSGITTGVVRCGYGGQTSATVTGHLTGAGGILLTDSARQGDSWIVWDGQNDMLNSTGTSDYLTNFDAKVTAITTGGLGHDRLLFIPPMQDASGMTSATGGWVRSVRAMRTAQTDATRQKYIWEGAKKVFRGLSPGGSSGTAADDLAVARLSSSRGLIPSLAASFNGHNDHPNYIMAPLQAALYYTAVQAMQNQAIMPLDCTRFIAWDAPAGTKLNVHVKGYCTSASLKTDDPSVTGMFTVALKSGSNSIIELTRTSANAATWKSILNLVVTANGVTTTGAACTADAVVRICPTLAGATDQSPKGALLPRDTVQASANDHRTLAASSQSWPFIQSETAPFAAGQPLTVVACGLYFQQDTTDSILLQLKSGSTITVQRISGKLNFLVKSTAGVNLLNWSQTVTPTINLANGPFNIMFSYDNNGGTPRGSMWLWSAATGNKDVSPGSALTAGTAATAGIVTFFSASSDQPTTGFGLKSVFMSDTWTDGSVAANLDQFWNSSTGVPVDLVDGTLGGARHPYWKFFPGDVLLNGGQFGNGPASAFRDNWLEGFSGSSSDPLSW